MSKYALVYSNKNSFWKSCVTITDNILETYKVGFPKEDLVSIDLNDEMSSKEVWDQAEHIFSLRPERIVFIDHNPHPFELIQYLDRFYKGELPPLYFHIYGDFICLSNLYNKIRPILEKTQTTFFVASRKHQKLLGKLLKKPEKNVFYLPFPVLREKFFFDEKLRKKVRDDWKVDDKEKIFLYTGRITHQKNVLTLVKSFVKYLTLAGSGKLLVAGDFHDMGIPYLGKLQETGMTFYNWQKMLYNLPEKFKDRIVYLGNLNTEELQSLYCGADIFVSLSTFNDEDFGMSPAEALCCGTPSILTDWGGYSDFHTMGKDFVSSIPVKIGMDDFEVNERSLLKAFFKESEGVDRQMVSENFLNALSVQSVSEELVNYYKNIKPQKMEFNVSKFEGLSEAFETRYSAPFKSKAGGFNQLYYELYASYAN